MKPLTLIAALAVAPICLAETSYPELPDNSKLNFKPHTEKSENFTKATGMLDANLASPHFSVENCATQEPSPANPFGLTLGWATDKQTYAMTSTIWEYDWRGIRGVNAVALAGLRLNDNVPVVGGGLEYGIQFPLAKRVDFYGTFMIGGIWEQNESIDKVRGIGTLKIGVVIF